MPQGPEYRSFLPHLSYARVVNYDPSNHGVFISFPSGQQLAQSAKILINGPADQSRVEQNPLPVIGTWGVVAFPQGDLKSAIWLGSFYQSPVNAVTTSNPPNQADSQIKYMSHASGTYSILDYAGNYTYWSPDGTVIHLNVDNQEPTTYQYVMNSDTLAQELTPVTHDYRRPFGSPPFYASVTHPSGANVTIAPDGTVTVMGGNFQTASMVLTPKGVVTVSTGATGQTGQAATNSQIVLTPQASGNDPTVSIIGNNGDAGQANINISQQGDMALEVTNSSRDLKLIGGGTVHITAQNSSLSIAAPNSTVSISANGDITINTGGTVKIGDNVALAGGGAAVARVGDTTTCPAGTGHITSGSAKVSSG